MKKLLKTCWISFACLLILVAILFSFFRALTPWVIQYKSDVEKRLSFLVGQPVTVNSMETSWYWFEPVLKLNQVTVNDNQEHALTFNKLLVGIDLFSSLWHWNIQPGVLYVDDAHLAIHQVDKHWKIDGLQQNKQVNIEPDLYLPVLGWLLSQQKIIIKNVSADVFLTNGKRVPLSAFNFTAINSGGRYRLKGNVKLAQPIPTELDVIADLRINSNEYKRVTGQAYVSLDHFSPIQWQDYFPQTAYRLKSGKGKIDVWLDLNKGKLSSLQTRVDFKRMAIVKDNKSPAENIQSLQANLAWKPTGDGWRLSGDKIKLRARGIDWPDNQFVLQQNRAQNSYRLFVQHVLIEPLLATKIDWPTIMKPIIAIHPSGELHDTQIELMEGKVAYLLTRFTNLSWKNQDNLPGVGNLSGALSWQPTEGRLDLDGEQTSLVFKGYKPITFVEANANIEWKELNQGLRISMERLVLRHPELIFSARGVLDDPFSTENRALRLTAEFSAENAEQWLAYVPSKYLKPKLDEWLKHDIKHIDKASGQMNIDGLLSDFPFVDKPGEFSIGSSLTGVDLFFNKRWPICNDIDAYLRINKRSLDADIVQATTQGVLIDSANLHIDDLGLNKETLLFHGKAEANAPQAVDYVFNSPLSKHLGKLKLLNMQGELDLDLRLEVPLYPEKDDVYARGNIHFNNDQIVFHHALTNVEMNSFTGELQFNENGVTDSGITATLLGEPVTVHIQTKTHPKPLTEVTLEGNTSIDMLRDKFNLPLLNYMQGQFKVDGTIDLTDDVKEADRIQINSTLEGVTIDLPKPFGKTAGEQVPLSLALAIANQKPMRLAINYQDRLSADFALAQANNGLSLSQGEIRIGKGLAELPHQSGLRIVGSIPSIDVKQWSDMLANDTATSGDFLQKLSVVNMKVDNVILWGQNYPTLAIKAKKIAREEWDVNFDQRYMSGDIQYQRATNSLSGNFKRLYLTKSFVLGRSRGKTLTKLKPKDIPNLDLAIDDFKWEAVDIGNVAIKSKSSSSQWHLDYCKVRSPDYELSLKGDWDFSNKKNASEVQADFQTANVAQCLQRWQITPVVEAHQATIHFQGGWPGGPADFVLRNNTGQAYITLKNGQITHLSPETEKKIGLGKLLSILSLQTIPRRLKLDFSDLSNTGYTFDEFKGNFTLKKGVMNTNDSYIDGPVAYVSMKGDLDLLKRLYDLELQVTPHITASLPVVATIAGGPIAGMATWVASKIINQGMQIVTNYTYKVSGPWVDPVVQQVSINKKR